MGAKNPYVSPSNVVQLISEFPRKCVVANGILKCRAEICPLIIFVNCTGPVRCYFPGQNNRHPSEYLNNML